MKEKRQNLGIPLTESAEKTPLSVEDAGVCQNRDGKLNEIKQRIEEHWGQCETSYLDIGKDLLEAKTLFGKHGKWLDWVKENVSIPVRKAQRLMRVAEWFGNTPPGTHLDFSKAYILTRIPKAKLKDFLERYISGDADMEPLRVIQGISKRDLEKAVCKYLLSSTTASKVQKVERTSDISPEISVMDSVLDTLCRLEATMYGLVENATNRQVDGECEMIISELRRLCNETLDKLPADDVEEE